MNRRIKVRRYLAKSGKVNVGYVSRVEVWQVAKLANLDTITEVMKLLFPRMITFSCRGDAYRFIEKVAAK